VTETTVAPRRDLSRLWFALAAGGVAFTAIQLVVGNRIGIFPVPGGDTYIWDRVGDLLRSGNLDVYAIQANRDNTFWYAPPWAVVWAAVSWLPPEVLYALLFVAKVGALRVIGGSWTAAGLACWFPLVAFDLASGNLNLVIAAAIVAAVYGRPGPAVAMSLAKLSPALAIDLRQWRRVLALGLICLAITLPWLALWPAWFAHLVDGFGQPFGPQVAVPFVIRFPIALGLVAFRRRWSRALAAFIAIPALYYGSLVVLVAPVAVICRELTSRGAGPARPTY
jgi:hypothetical protein